MNRTYPVQMAKASEHSAFEQRGTVMGNMGQLKQIRAGKEHVLHLTRDGFVYSYGDGSFAVVGQGGAKQTHAPVLLKQLSDK